MDAILIYIDDWDSSKKIAMMDAPEELGYFYLLKAAAKADDCGLPDDDNQLAILSKLGQQWFRVTKEPAKRIADEQKNSKTSGRKLRECFFSGGTRDPKTGDNAGRPGRLYNSKLLEVHRQYLTSVEQRRKAANARWQGGNKPRQPNAKTATPDAAAYAAAMREDMREGMRNGCGEHPIPIPISNTNTTSSPVNGSSQNGYDPSAGWNWFQSEYPKHRLNPHMDLQLWISVVTSLEVETEVREKLPRFKGSAEWTENGGRMVPSASKFLGERRFLMEPGPIADAGAATAVCPEESEAERRVRDDEMRTRLQASRATA